MLLFYTLFYKKLGKNACAKLPFCGGKTYAFLQKSLAKNLCAKLSFCDGLFIYPATEQPEEFIIFRQTACGQFVNCPYINYLSSFKDAGKQKFKLLKNQSIILGNRAAGRIYNFPANCLRTILKSPVCKSLKNSFFFWLLDCLFSNFPLRNATALRISFFAYFFCKKSMIKTA